MSTKRNRISFNKKTLEDLPFPVPGGKARHFDAKTPGLAIRVYGPPRTDPDGPGRKSFVYVRRVEGQLGQITLGEFPAMTVEQARGRAGEHNALIASGQNPFDGARARREELTLRALFQLYLDEHLKPYKKPRTVKEFKAMFDLHVGPLAGRRLSRIRRQNVAALHRKIGEHAKVAANRVVTMLRGVFNWARKAELFTGENPTLGLPRYREKSRERFLQPDEIPQFFDALAREENTTVRDFFAVSLNTGARKSNVLAMRWDQVNLDRGTWTIPETKNGSAQVVALSRQAVKILSARDAGRQWVFPHAESFHPGSWRRIKRRLALTELGCPDEALQRMRWDELDLALGIWNGPTGRKVLPPETAHALRGMAPSREYVFPGPGAPGHLKDPKAGWRRLLQRAGLASDDPAKRLRIHDLRRTLGSRQAALGTSLVVIGASLGHKSPEATKIYARLNQDPVQQSVQDAMDSIYALRPSDAQGEVRSINSASSRKDSRKDSRKETTR